MEPFWLLAEFQKVSLINASPMCCYLKENKPFHNSFEQRPLEPPPMFNNMPIGGRMDGPNSNLGNMPPRGPSHGVSAPRWGRPNERDREDFLVKRRRF